MNGCASHGELVGGYVLGALEPGEMEEMRRHLEWCPACGPEARRMEELPALLDRIEPDDVPPPALAPEVEEAVLDRFARERPREEERPRRRAPRALRRLAPVAAALALAGLLLLLILPSDESTGPGSQAYATARLAPPVASSQASAYAYADAVPAGTRVRLWARGLRPGSYELWCVRADGRWISGGTFRAGSGGAARAQMTAAVKPGDYHVMVVTRRSKAERGAPVLRGELKY